MLIVSDLAIGGNHRHLFIRDVVFAQFGFNEFGVAHQQQIDGIVFHRLYGPFHSFFRAKVATHGIHRHPDWPGDNDPVNHIADLYAVSHMSFP